MNLDEIVNKLKEAFQQSLNEGEQRKIIFWLDKDREFMDVIDEVRIDNVKIHKWTETNNFYTKYLLEVEDPTSHYLIYTNNDLNQEDNWLMDTVLYSQIFYADRISLLMNDLGIDSSLRNTIKQYEKFFGNKERYRKFKAYGISSYTKEIIEIAIISVLCNLKTPDFEDALKTILMDSLDDQENKYLGLIEKYLDLNVFWTYVSNLYGYRHPKKTLKSLFMHLTVTALSHAVDPKHLTIVKDYIADKNKSNALVFIDHWMHHKSDYIRYDELAENVEKELNIAEIVSQLDVEDYKLADTFPYFDKAIIIHIANSLEAQLEDFDEYIKLINLRRAKHFYERFKYIYEALFYTVKMFEFYKKHSMGIPKTQAVEMFKAYIHDYYQMDTYYRKFYVAFDNEPNSEILKKLKVMVENLYTNWFMGELSSHWSIAVETEIKHHWSLPGVSNQTDFYRSFVAPKVDKGDRVFVIISDAMRYEIGVELANKLNSETIGVCDIQPMLGVIPSVTKLGMASLLPHKSIDIDLDGKVFVDHKVSSGLENRKEILESSVNESVAVHYQEFMTMNKAGRREFFKGKKLIYIYHDTIDAMGDKASTEVYTFSAVEKAVDEILNTVKVIRDDLSGTNILITSDHGFIYQRDVLEESDKIEKEKIQAIEIKRRYMLSQEKKEISGILDIRLDPIIKNEHQLTAYVPKANIRYKMQGSGVNYVHGGASLQEIVVPLIQFRNMRASQKHSKEIKKVDLKLTNTNRKITNSIFQLTFFQTEKVEDKVVPRIVTVYMADDSGTVISNEETIICDRTSNNPEERTFKIRFALKSLPYDKNKVYDLIIKDAETNIVVEKIPFRINLGIISDFDF
mgnify:CR=1 FL=1